MERPLGCLIEDLRLPGHKQLAAHWLDLYDRARALPRLSEIDALKFSKALADTWIADLETAEDGGQRFRFRLMGEKLVQWYGRNPKGLLYEDVFAPELLPRMNEESRQLLAGPNAAYHHTHSTIPHWTVPALFERLAFPLADASGKPAHLLGATVFNGESSAPDIGYWYRVPLPWQSREV